MEIIKESEQGSDRLRLFLQCLLEAEEMGQSTKGLSFKHEDPRSLLAQVEKAHTCDSTLGK